MEHFHLARIIPNYCVKPHLNFLIESFLIRTLSQDFIFLALVEIIAQLISTINQCFSR